jgi:hypothetical protein
MPEVRRVRNSVQHVEDRARGLGPSGKPLDLKPVDNRAINAPGGGVLILNMLNGSRYGSTVADGRYAEVDVTSQSLLAVRDAIQKVLNSLAWKEPADPRRSPSA